MTEPVGTLPSSRVEVRLPVIEVFGPTVQGEGPEAGLPVHFVRFGGCDFRCSWCDTMYAVEPALVRENADRLTVSDIAERVDHLGGKPEWVVLSGGNPALHKGAGALVLRLQEGGYKVAVETQGSIYRDWLERCQRVVVSPKPPSSGMDTHKHRAALRAFMRRLVDANPFAAVLKIVVFDDLDLAWAKRVFRDYPEVPRFLSAGTPVDAATEPDRMIANGDAAMIRHVRERYRWLCEAVANDPELGNCRVLPQLHVIAWGSATGV